jgi:hypothetical protein
MQSMSGGENSRYPAQSGGRSAAYRAGAANDQKTQVLMSPEQSIEARRLLGWSPLRLAVAADQPMRAIIEFEAGNPSAADVILSIQGALEAGGVEFISENGGGAGVRLRK